MLFKRIAAEPSEPVRPSHFREDPNVRTDLGRAELDYPDEGQTVEQDYGFPVDGRIEIPVPVYMVEAPPSDRSLRDWSAQTVTTGTENAIQIGAAADRGRRRVVVRNLDDTDSVVLLRKSTDSDFAGYTLPPNTEVEFQHNHALWVRADANSPQVSVLSEYDVDDLKALRHG
jgi:hypothetical protein